MGRKKIKIQPIKDDRNRQVRHITLTHTGVAYSPLVPLGHFSETKARPNEESLRIERALRLRDCSYYLQLEWEACSVCQYRD